VFEPFFFFGNFSISFVRRSTDYYGTFFLLRANVPTLSSPHLILSGPEQRSNLDVRVFPGLPAFSVYSSLHFWRPDFPLDRRSSFSRSGGGLLFLVGACLPLQRPLSCPLLLSSPPPILLKVRPQFFFTYKPAFSCWVPLEVVPEAFRLFLQLSNPHFRGCCSVWTIVSERASVYMLHFLPRSRICAFPNGLVVRRGFKEATLFLEHIMPGPRVTQPFFSSLVMS